MKVEIPNVQETGALGAAAIAMVGTGDYPDIVSAISHFDNDIRHFEPQLSKTHYYQKNMPATKSWWPYLKQWRNQKMPSKPRLQIALDSPNLANALEHAEKVSQFVEVIEVGTILAFSEGMEVVKTLRLKYPNYILVCDMKITDASKILTEIAARNGANWVTVVLRRILPFVLQKKPWIGMTEKYK